MMEWEEEFEECILKLEEKLDELKSYRASPNMFDSVPVSAYGDVYELSELGQCIVRGENNLLISVYDDTVKDAVMKALMVHDSELECSMEGKYISVKMGMTRSENRDAIVSKAKELLFDFKAHLSKERGNAMSVLKQLEKVLPMDDIEIQKKEVEDLYKSFQKKGQDVLDAKVVDIKRK
mmetsp:Transcript_25436/g.22599  ORF Transcript_25436/g.22599 Transcript_25436/m.22599 type:complete len:179 (+) Transcript_25436:248-784(+)